MAGPFSEQILNDVRAGLSLTEGRQLKQVHAAMGNKWARVSVQHALHHLVGIGEVQFDGPDGKRRYRLVERRDG